MSEAADLPEFIQPPPERDPATHVELQPTPWRYTDQPVKLPGFPFRKPARDAAADYFVNHLDSCELTFDRYFRGSSREKAEAEAFLKEHLPCVARSDARRRAINVSAEHSLAIAICIACVAALVTPLVISQQSLWVAIVVGLLGILGAAAILVTWALLEVPFGDGLEAPLGLLAMVALCAALTAWAYHEKPPLWVFFCASLIGFITLLLVRLLVIAIQIAFIAVLDRKKLRNDFRAELSDALIGALNALSVKSPYQADVVFRCNYIATMIDRFMLRELLGRRPSSMIRERVRGAVRDRAAGMREIAVRASLPKRDVNPGSAATHEGSLIAILAENLTAVSTGRYGDMFAVKDGGVVGGSRRKTALGLVRVAVAAFAPITLFLVLPWAFNFTVSSGLRNTLLSVSVAWLALYVVAWLDPKALAQVAALKDVSSMLPGGKT